MRRISFVVSGRVQGVGFRASAVAAARELDLIGFVRNRRDGAVEGQAQGATEAIAAFVAWLRQGPRLAHVASLDVQDMALDDRDREFEVRR